MLEKLKCHIVNERLFDDSKSLLLAVSGGADSMVLLHLFRQLNFRFEVLHCNFNLRDSESDGDQYFLEAYSAKHGLKLHVKHFSTKEEAKNQGVSIEMAARELRYQWFEEMRRALGFDYVLTAHHQDDLVETMLINLSRGTGIKGLMGIQAKRDFIVRPMLFSSRMEILNFAEVNRISYRHDSSNDELIYQRNLIRHQIIPLFDKLNPAFRENMVRTAKNLTETNEIYRLKIQEIEADLIDGEIMIEKIEKIPQRHTLIHEMFSKYGFNTSQCADINRAFDAESGRQFISKTHRIIKDRDKLILLRNQSDDQGSVFELFANRQVTIPIDISTFIFDRDADYVRSNLPGHVDLDMDKLQFPLTIRRWKKGDYFIPLGMKGRKKLSDFFTDLKMSLFEKESQWLLCSGEEIVWVIGRRISHLCRITQESKTICRVSVNLAN